MDNSLRKDPVISQKVSNIITKINNNIMTIKSRINEVVNAHGTNLRAAHELRNEEVAQLQKKYNDMAAINNSKYNDMTSSVTKGCMDKLLMVNRARKEETGALKTIIAEKDKQIGDFLARLRNQEDAIMRQLEVVDANVVGILNNPPIGPRGGRHSRRKRRSRR